MIRHRPAEVAWPARSAAEEPADDALERLVSDALESVRLLSEGVATAGGGARRTVVIVDVGPEGVSRRSFPAPSAVIPSGVITSALDPSALDPPALDPPAVAPSAADSAAAGPALDPAALDPPAGPLIVVVSGRPPGPTPAGVADHPPPVRAGDLEEVPSLTHREREVLACLAAGAPAKAVARQLEISVNTCRGHIKALHAKLGVTSQLEAVVKARALGLVDAEAGPGPGSTRPH